MPFLRVRNLRPVLRLGGNYFHNLSVVNGLSYRRKFQISDAISSHRLNNVVRVVQSVH